MSKTKEKKEKKPAPKETKEAKKKGTDEEELKEMKPKKGKSSSKGKKGRSYKKNGHGRQGGNNVPKDKEDQGGTNVHENPDKNTAPGNDFAWYNKNPDLLTSAGSIIFSKKYGDPYKSVSYNGTGHTVSTGNRAVGGVVRAQFFEYVNAEGSDDDAINIAAKNLYTWLRHKNGGAKVFEQSDLIQVLLASGSVKVLLEYAKKLLRCVLTYSPVNRYAMRYVIPFDNNAFQAMVDNSANYTAKLNILIAKATSIVIPKDISVFSRWKWLAANIFRDDDQKKCTYYTFDPYTLWHYDWENRKCEAKRVLPSTFDQLLTMISDEINNLLQYEDYGTISGDILKAYGESECDVTTAIALGEVQDAAYDVDAIRQFKNMIIGGEPYGDYELRQLNSNSQLLTFVNTDSDLQNALPGKYVWNTGAFEDAPAAGITVLPKLMVKEDVPTIEDVVEQTRFSGVIKSAQVGDNILLYFDYVGTEVIVTYYTYYFEEGTTGSVRTSSLETLLFIDISNSTSMKRLIGDRAVVTGIDGDPQYYIGFIDDDAVYIVQYFEGSNIALLDANYLETLHKACVMSEWTMPMFKFLETK